MSGERQEVIEELLGSRSRVWLDGNDLMANMNGGGGSNGGEKKEKLTLRLPTALAVITR